MLHPRFGMTSSAETSSTKTREILERQAELLRGRLRQLQPELMRELESLELAIRNLSPDPNATEYAGYRLGIDAIEAYLEKHHHAALGSVIAKAIANGGWLAKDDRADINIVDSIRYHLKHPTKRIKAFSGVASDPANAVIGKYAWDESYYPSPTSSPAPSRTSRKGATKS
jgi:hypothetical protein